MTESGNKAFLGVMFKCCNIYSRIYLTKKKDAFAGHCPKCAKPIRIRISPDGSKSNFFEIS